METEAPDSSPITICSLILPPSLSFYLLGLALPGAAPTPGEHGSFLGGVRRRHCKPHRGDRT